jgi:hypothetical protein
MASDYWKGVLAKVGLGILVGGSPKVVVQETATEVVTESLVRLIEDGKVETAYQRILIDVIAARRQVELNQREKAIETLTKLESRMMDAIL